MKVARKQPALIDVIYYKCDMCGKEFEAGKFNRRILTSIMFAINNVVSSGLTFEICNDCIRDIIKLTHHEVCSLCNGSGKLNQNHDVACYKCDGRGVTEIPKEIPTQNKCERCQGTGFFGESTLSLETRQPIRILCTACDGTGRKKVIMCKAAHEEIRGQTTIEVDHDIPF